MVIVLKGVAYIRVSTKEQDESVQLESIKQFCSLKGIELLKVYIDKGESGSKPFKERPEANKMIKELEEIKPDVIVSWALDRFGRTMLDTLNMVISLENMGYKIITVKEEWLQTLDENIRKLILGILSWVAEFERKRIRERQEEAWKQGKMKGRPPKVSDDVLKEYYRKYSKYGYGSKKYMWLRLREDGYDISYDRLIKRLKKLVKVKEVVA